MKQLLWMVLCLALVLLVACAKQEIAKSPTPSKQPETAPAPSAPSADSEANGIETSVSEINDLEQDLGTEYLDAVDKDLDSVDSLELS